MTSSPPLLAGCPERAGRVLREYRSAVRRDARGPARRRLLLCRGTLLCNSPAASLTHESPSMSGRCAACEVTVDLAVCTARPENRCLGGGTSRPNEPQLAPKVPCANPAPQP